MKRLGVDLKVVTKEGLVFIEKDSKHNEKSIDTILDNEARIKLLVDGHIIHVKTEDVAYYTFSLSNIFMESYGERYERNKRFYAGDF